MPTPVNLVNSNIFDNPEYFLITIDVEDWFQVENFKKWIPYSSWESKTLRVERNVHRLLNLFSNGKAQKNDLLYEKDIEVKTKGINLQNGGPVRATFFVLGWVAERLPGLIREIQSRGHEIASHGTSHMLPNIMSERDLREDLFKSKSILEDIVGKPVTGFRAPSFAINENVLRIIRESGYVYDSSYNSFSFNKRYGRVSLDGSQKHGIAFETHDNFYEIPISNLTISVPLKNWSNVCIDLPSGGGGYFRLLPWWIFKIGITKFLKKNDAYMFYVHPWEIDHNQPKVNSASFGFKFRHYTNINSTKSKLKRLIENFSHCNFVSCAEYLKLSASVRY